MDSSRRLRELVDLERTMAGPSADDRRRNRVRLARQLGLGAAAGASAVTTSTWGAWIASAPAKFLATVAVAAAGSGSAAWLASGLVTNAERASTPVGAVAAAPSRGASVAFTPPAGADPGVASAAPVVAPEPVVAPRPSLAAADVAEPPANGSQPAPGHAANDTLAAQARLLAGMRAAMRAGQPAKALSQLEEAAALANVGALSEELLATRVFALCQLGRESEARHGAASFAGRFPGSPLLARVQGACGAR